MSKIINMDEARDRFSIVKRAAKASTRIRDLTYDVVKETGNPDIALAVMDIIIRAAGGQREPMRWLVRWDQAPLKLQIAILLGLANYKFTRGNTPGVPPEPPEQEAI